MSNRFTLPLETPVDSTGAPYPGGQLFFYASGTSTKLNTYSDPDLAAPHANSNPVILDSAGRFPNAIFLQNLEYKVVLAPANDTDPPTSPIWTQDPVYTSDYSAQAKFKSGAGSPNGVVAGTAGSATVSADSYWDITNNILYICTTTGTASTAVWTAVNASTAAAVIPPPQGRLTLTSGVPVLAADVTAATAVYYTTYLGNLCPIYNGTSFVPISFTEQMLTLVSSHVASNIYDIFMFNNGGVPTIVTGPSWSAGSAGSITAGSCARGTGAGGTALSRVTGILTNAVSITGRNGNTTYTIAANLATYLGSIFMDGTNGQVSCYTSYGQSRKWGVWNAYNRVPVYLKSGDSTASWSYGTNTWRPSNNSTANSLIVFSGLAEDIYDLAFAQKVNLAVSPTSESDIGIGVNVTNAPSGLIGTDIVNWFNTANVSPSTVVPAKYLLTPSLGIETITALEKSPTNAGTYYGTEANMLLSALWRS